MIPIFVFVSDLQRCCFLYDNRFGLAVRLLRVTFSLRSCTTSPFYALIRF